MSGSVVRFNRREMTEALRATRSECQGGEGEVRGHGGGRGGEEEVRGHGGGSGRRGGGEGSWRGSGRRGEGTGHVATH